MEARQINVSNGALMWAVRGLYNRGDISIQDYGDSLRRFSERLE